MEARGLFYEQGSASYGHSELAKLKTMIKKMVFHSSSLVYGEQDFWKWYYFQQQLMVSETVVKF